MEKNLQNKEALKKFKELAEEVNICMFLTFGNDGKHSARPMATIEVDEDANLWFFASKQSHKIQELSVLKAVHLVYSHPGKDSYLDVWGNADVIEDRNKIKQMWKPIIKAWFPEGSDDPNLCLIKVAPSKAFYWDSTNSKMIEGIKIIASMITGKKLAEGEEGSLEL